jgi:hypothetical protein
MVHHEQYFAAVGVDEQRDAVRPELDAGFGREIDGLSAGRGQVVTIDRARPRRTAGYGAAIVARDVCDAPVRMNGDILSAGDRDCGTRARMNVHHRLELTHRVKQIKHICADREQQRRNDKHQRFHDQPPCRGQ